MKRYIKCAVSIENLKTQFAQDMDDNTFKDLIDIDPSADFEKSKGGKYCPWIFRQYNKGNLNIVDDGTNLKDALGYFLLHYKKYPKSDIGQYKTVQEFLTDTEAVGNRELTDKEKQKLLKKQAHHANTEDKKFCVEDGVWEVWTPLTYPGSISLAREGGTKATWCTAYEGDDYYYKRYTRQGPLYIFLNTSDPNEKYQLHFESESWFDIGDRRLGMPAFYTFCDEHPAIKEFFDIKTENGVNTRAGSIVAYQEDAKEIIIPDGVSQLNYNIDFPDTVEKIIIPDSIKSLDSECFRSLKNLTEIKLPGDIKKIPARAFEGCSALASIDIPDSVKLYSKEAFRGCENLKTIKHSSSLIGIDDLCFAMCPVLETDIPDSVTYIGKHIFDGCEKITSIQIPSGITEINAQLFQNNSTLEYIDFNNVISIGSHAFRNTAMEDVDISKVTFVGAGAFRSSKLKHLDFVADGAVIGLHAFEGCPELAGSVTILPNMDIGMGAFDNCPKLTVEWDAEDQDYEFENIKLLVCDEKKHPKLFKANKGYVAIETTEGKTYPVDD